MNSQQKNNPLPQSGSITINSQPSTINSFWPSLSTYVTVLAEWRTLMGPDFPPGQAFLRSTGELAEEYPCIHATPCGCHHRVSDYGDLHAVCTCGEDDGEGCSPCPEFPLTEEDLHTYAPDIHKFTAAIRLSLGIDGDQATSEPGTHDLWRIGTKSHIPVYFCLTNMGAVGAFQCLVNFFTAHREPALLLVQSDRAASCLPASLRNRHAIVPLPQVLRIGDGAKFELTQPLDPILRKLNDYQPSTINHQLPSQLSALTSQLGALGEKISSLANEHQNLRASKQRLEKMSAEGFFAFTQKVDAESFKILCAILAEGDVAKAARAIGKAKSTLHDLVQSWNSREAPYRVMADIVRWRKTVGGKQKVPFNPAMFHEKQRSADYSGLLSEVLDGLLSMTEGNWQEQCTELADLLREHAPR